MKHYFLYQVDNNNFQLSVLQKFHMIINETRKYALRLILNQQSHIFAFCTNKGKGPQNKKSDGISEESLGKFQGIIQNMRTDSKIAHKQRTESNALYKHSKRVNDHLVELTYYMRHNHWKSQFIYLLLNYNKLGFKIVSDYAFLDSASYMLEIRNIKEEDRWPTVRVIIGLRPRIIVTGAQEIEKFFVDNFYFQETLLKESPEHQFPKKFIDEEILPNMQSLLWHPTLTYQTTFHTDIYYHSAEQKNYMLVEILWRNFGKCGKAIFTNIWNIIKEKQRYLESKEKLTKALKQMSDLYLKKNEYFGGQKPNFIDFYLLAHLKTNWQSRYFRAYLEQAISDEFKRWILRMGWNCEYSRDRATVL